MDYRAFHPWNKKQSSILAVNFGSPQSYAAVIYAASQKIIQGFRLLKCFSVEGNLKMEADGNKSPFPVKQSL